MLTLEPKFQYRVANIDHMIYHGDPGTGLPRHTHMYSHVTVCHQGSCCIRKQGRELVINNSHPPINLVAGEWHEIEVLEPGTVFENVFEVTSE
jgi:quercetin dioxygenase-like cupin family protein